MSNSIRPTSKDAIIEAAFELLSGNPGASLSDISERAGIGRATLHRHFSSREELVRSLARIAIDEIDEAAEAACEKVSSHAQAFERMFLALIPLGDRHGFIIREPLDDDPEFAAEFERQAQEMRDLIEEAKSEGLFAASIPTEWINQVFDHLIYAAWESVKSGDITYKQAAKLAWRTMKSGLGG